MIRVVNSHIRRGRWAAFPLTLELTGEYSRDDYNGNHDKQPLNNDHVKILQADATDEKRVLAEKKWHHHKNRPLSLGGMSHFRHYRLLGRAMQPLVDQRTTWFYYLRV